VEIINYSATDFLFTVYCNNIKKLYEKARAHSKNIDKSTRYLFNGEIGRFILWTPGKEGLQEVAHETTVHPVFFENLEYHIEFTFKEMVDRFRILCRSEDITQKFSTRKRSHEQTFHGVINFVNDIGNSEIRFLYERNGLLKNYSIHFEVFSTKIDFKRDHLRLVKEVEEEYSKLSLDIFKKTYSNFKSLPGQGNDLTWWFIFVSLFNDLILSIKFVLNRPHSRLVTSETLCKSEQIKTLTHHLEEEIVRYKWDPNKFYKVTSKRHSHNTIENRFLKYVATYTLQKFTAVVEYLKKEKNNIRIETNSVELEEIGPRLKAILSHPLFKTTGGFAGLNQESAVLQKKAGYSTVYRNWILLRRSIQLFEGVRQIDLKNIAVLYQFWCFIKIKNIIQSLLNTEPEKIDLESMIEGNSIYTLRRGLRPLVTFTSKTGDRIELYHELNYQRLQDDLNFAGVFTEEQRPDITLRITKVDIHESHVFTYLYDAKYRLDSDDKGLDRPPIDAINQMHRYRDAIYQLGDVGKEIMGAYILFPGTSSAEVVKNSSYFESINAINLGAFALTPGDRHDGEILLKEHLRDVLFSDSHSLLKKVIPYKGLKYQETDDTVLIAFPSAKGLLGNYDSDDKITYLIPLLSDQGATHQINLGGKVKFFAPATVSTMYYYNVESITVKSWQEIQISELGQKHSLECDPGKLFYVFHLSGRKDLPTPIFPLSGKDPDFLYWKLSDLKKMKIGAPSANDPIGP
jgi:predicted component of viral defense system (DUF524 family)